MYPIAPFMNQGNGCKSLQLVEYCRSNFRAVFLIFSSPSRDMIKGYEGVTCMFFGRSFSIRLVSSCIHSRKTSGLLYTINSYKTADHWYIHVYVNIWWHTFTSYIRMQEKLWQHAHNYA